MFYLFVKKIMREFVIHTSILLYHKKGILQYFYYLTIQGIMIIGRKDISLTIVRMEA